jgi:solute carrier family 25 phosphate transporter 3
LAGSFVCGGSHLITTPLDVLKCRIQVYSFKFHFTVPFQVDKTKFQNLATALRVTVHEGGLRGLARGWAPTGIGYGFQGFAKFGFYEASQPFSF